MNNRFVLKSTETANQISLTVILTVSCLLKLLYVRHGYSSLSLCTRDELVYAISHLLTSKMCIVFLLFSCVQYLVYDFQ